MSDDRPVETPASAEDRLSPAELLVAMRRDKKLREAKAARRKEEPFQFGFTSLMDALTVLLMFLLITISSDPLNVQMDERLLLATSTASFDAKDAIPILVKKGFIAVDDKEVVRIDCRLAGAPCTDEQITRKTICTNNAKGCSASEIQQLKTMAFSVDKINKEDGEENSFLIVPLLKALEEKVKSEQEENRELKRDFKGMVNIICDRDMPFRLVAEVVHTAGTAQLSNMRFAIIKVGSR
jgi:biopolymer transport protein ExbD